MWWCALLTVLFGACSTWQTVAFFDSNGETLALVQRSSLCPRGLVNVVGRSSSVPVPIRVTPTSPGPRRYEGGFKSDEPGAPSVTLSLVVP